MKYVCIDIEMTETVDRKQRRNLHGLRHEIIQLGAVLLDEQFRYLSCIEIPVKPQFCTVTPFIEQLTGITDASLESADSLDISWEKYLSWVGREPVKVFCWSNSDFIQLWDELWVKYGYQNRYMKPLKSFIDLQQLVDSAVGSGSALSLDGALRLMGCSFKGQRHSALGDALNTARILKKMSGERNFNPDSALVYGKAITIHIENDNLYQLNYEETCSFASYVPEELKEKYMRKTVVAKSSVEEYAETQRGADDILSRFVKKHFPKSFCVRYQIPVRTWFWFLCRMNLRRDLAIPDFADV